MCERKGCIREEERRERWGGGRERELQLLNTDVEEDELDTPGPRPLSRMPEVVWTLRKKLASRLQLKPPEDKPPRKINLKLSVTETDFVVLEDMTSLESNAVVLKVVMYS